MKKGILFIIVGLFMLINFSSCKGKDKAEDIYASENSTVWNYYYTASLLRAETSLLTGRYGQSFEELCDNYETYENLYEISGLKDKNLEAELEKFIYESIKEFTAPDYQREFIDRVTEGSEYVYLLPIRVEESCKNGYYSLYVSISTSDSPDSYNENYGCRSITYDLYSGKKIEDSDLFYEDEPRDMTGIFDNDDMVRHENYLFHGSEMGEEVLFNGGLQYLRLKENPYTSPEIVDKINNKIEEIIRTYAPLESIEKTLSDNGIELKNVRYKSPWFNFRMIAGECLEYYFSFDVTADYGEDEYVDWNLIKELTSKTVIFDLSTGDIVP